jgi:thiamine-phosphate pyrophosphorylase
MEAHLTPGAQRAWQLAEQLAHRFAARTVEPEHLLWGLVLDESRAAEILTTHQLSFEQLRKFLAAPPAENPEARASAGTLPPRGETLETVFLEARRQVARVGGHGEVGTEHLLFGLAAIPSSVQTLLFEHGLKPDELVRLESDHTGHGGPPLATGIHLSLAGPPEGEKTDVYRILDAAANRAREGLRVLEDYVRFTVDDRHLTERLKTWRHRLAELLRLLDGRRLLSARDTLGDVGTTIHTKGEQTRGTLTDVVRASCKRVQEAARTLEEYGKLVSAEFAQGVGELRYAAYTFEKAILTTSESQSRLENCRLYLLVTQALCPQGAGPVIRAALAAGVGAVQVREKKLPDRELVAWGGYVREWTAAAGALYIMNDRPDLAVLTDADGVHIGQDELSVRDARRIVGPDRLIGVSTHTIEQARNAVLDGADYIGVGPVFPSATKSFSDFAGLDLVREVAAEIALPAFAIGGITPQNFGDVVAAGGRRVAVSHALCSADDPAQAARALLTGLWEASAVGQDP